MKKILKLLEEMNKFYIFLYFKINSGEGEIEHEVPRLIINKNKNYNRSCNPPSLE